MSYWYQPTSSTADFVYPPQAQFRVQHQPTLSSTQARATQTFRSTHKAAASSRFGDPATLAARERMRREDLIDEINRSQRAQRLSEWYSRQHSGRRAAERKRNQESLKSELSIANEELKNVRREKLRAKLEADHQIITKELALKGLALLTVAD
jgi:hypothetical protein